MASPVAGDRRRARACYCCDRLYARLDPCPHCGDLNPRMSPYTSWLSYEDHHANMDAHRVECQMCGAAGGIRSGPSEAALVWNQRKRQPWNRRCA